VVRVRVWVNGALMAGIVIASAWAFRAAAQNAVNPDAAVMQDFKQRVGEYVKLSKSADTSLPSLKKPTDSAAKIREHQHALRKAIMARRAGAVQGAIFTPQISAEFRRLIGIAYQSDARHIRESLLHAEPGTWNVQIHVNGEYPDDRPLQSMPPSLLINLPPLPPELEYRLVGSTLVLRDVGANLVVDILPRVIPK
jgi:hypothetical protein